MAKVSPVVVDSDEEMPGIVENDKEVLEPKSDDEEDNENDEDASEYEIEAIIDAKRGVYPEVCHLPWSFHRQNAFYLHLSNLLSGKNRILGQMERLSRLRK